MRTMTPFRPILPAVRPRRTLPVEDHPKRRQIVVACQSCRRHKSRRNSTCDYYTPTETRQIWKKHGHLQQQQSTYEDFIGFLRTMTEQDAVEVFRLLKAGTNIDSIVKHVRDGNLLLQLSLIPETFSQYESPYMTKMPSCLFVRDSSYMSSCLYKLVSSSPAYTHAENKQLTARYGSAYTMPYHTAKMVEPLIDKITMTPWTIVISDNRLLIRLIFLYFTGQYPCAPLVHKDLFLEDMAAGGTLFFSPLLTRLSKCALTFQIESRCGHPESLTYKFLAEARRIWDVELTGKPQITTIQAALVLSMTYAFNSLDELSTFFLEQAVTMGHHMHLFDASNPEEDPKMAEARLFTAWKVFSWQTMFDYSYFRELHIKDPLQTSYGEIWVQYPHDQNLTPLNLRYYMRAEARLSTVINELGCLCFGRSRRSLNTSEILAFERKLDAWEEAQPDILQPERLVMPLHFSLYNKGTDYGLGVVETPYAIMRASEIMLESLIRLYYMRHSFVHYDPWLIPAITRLGNDANRLLEGGPGEDPANLDGYRPTIILCAKALESQAQNIHIATSLGIQLYSVIKPQTLQLIRTYVKAVQSLANSHYQP
ncbi:hypothetical protein COCC4DRAFT_122531 [Bipolaris maydis ATCC 48331]|uniref:Xylanolytic transcriptional activator regulatory domain-containing protein n=2 Tax=Cochliobolus heterostrophus TaxID=5016 RepID=M2V8F2_COCH5|nr:uncharacterized protein COCC4DRAFT_122531 [Bipolaris maydis ATCC 48331]EMD96008.1 hypothetical protein COCHEDRAFT_1152094 [Bipolaris maydis C5]ENI10866.1 hypothetical protein COCC4DRAFT_122531 [Bipolaris maydis ATCC 48331]KAJ6274454.1 hypothetical protein PSV08DRAFT_368026 [Bipolaris maydis]